MNYSVLVKTPDGRLRTKSVLEGAGGPEKTFLLHIKVTLYGNSTKTLINTISNFHNNALGFLNNT